MFGLSFLSPLFLLGLAAALLFAPLATVFAMALENGVKGGRWYSLMDKVAAPRTLAAAWERVRANWLTSASQPRCASRYCRTT